MQFALNAVNEPTFEQKVQFLSQPGAYKSGVAQVDRRETHMSWVMLTDDRAYKLKKPVRFPYLDFSTLARREIACRAELRLNRRLAPDVYLGVVPLISTPHGLSLDGRGEIVDWLVAMHRLDEAQTLERTIRERRVETWHIDQLARTLARFYRCATPVFVTPAIRRADWEKSLLFNRRILLDPRLNMPVGLVRRVDSMLRKFLSSRSNVLAARVMQRKIVDGHGDLRPEHIWLGDPVRIIDCLEFNPRLRAVDPFDEIAFLSLECERLGAAWVGRHLKRRLVRALRDGFSEELFLFYRCHRAMLRARLAIAHLLEPNPRMPEKWPRLALAYLQLAAADARRLERLLKTRKGR
jgi:aminoglycoside phosphotransferase family enzyme